MPPSMAATEFLARERRIAISAVVKASRVCQTVASQLISTDTVVKDDMSPVTVADFSAQAVVNTMLQKEFPADPIVGEEDARDLRGDNTRAKRLRSKVVDLANSVLDRSYTANQLLDAIDRGCSPGASNGRQWTLDPIDGTKGFLRAGQYAVCLALIIDGQVQLGVMGCPNLPVDPTNPDGERGCIFVAVRNCGAFQRKIFESDETPIRMSPATNISEAVFCESVEAGHSSHDDAAKIACALRINKPPVRMDSQCKYATIARGAADIYLRIPVRADYEENIWDHATGALLVHEAGGIVTDITGKQLDFSLGRTLKANAGIVAASTGIHEQVVAAVRNVLKI